MLYYLFLGLTIILTIILTLVAQIQVSAARRKYKIIAPKTVGDDNFERVFRAHQNQLEANCLFLPLAFLQFLVGAVMMELLLMRGSASWVEPELSLLEILFLGFTLLPNFTWLAGRALYIYGYNTNHSKIKLIGGIVSGVAFVVLLLIISLGLISSLLIR